MKVVVARIVERILAGAVKVVRVVVAMYSTARIDALVVIEQVKTVERVGPGAAQRGTEGCSLTEKGRVRVG